MTCNDCNKGFGSKRNLNRHRALVHQGERPHQCPGCKKTDGKKHNMKTHIAIVHQGEKPHQCPECEKTFCKKHVMKTVRDIKEKWQGRGLMSGIHHMGSEG